MLDEPEWKHLWMVPYLRLMPSAETDKKIPKTVFHAHPIQVDLPMRIFDWHTFIEQAKEFFKVNYMPFLLLLSGGIAEFHYKKMLETISKFHWLINQCFTFNIASGF